MNLGATRARIQMLTRELVRSWEDTQGSWRDQKAEEFDQLYMQELIIRVEKASAIIDKLDQLLEKVKSDCE